MNYLISFLIFAFLFIFLSDLQADEYTAFSLKVAQQRIISTAKAEDYRKLHPEVFYLGGITAVRGLVYDRKTGDVILVGERNSNRAPLTLDDFVVALRARFIHGKWPLVSIDPTEETKKTEMQTVRFEGGIEDTQFGEDLFDADYRLKRIGMGLLPPGVDKVKTYWDLGMERAKEWGNQDHKIGSRFWFYPVLPSVTVREDVVAIKGLKLGVFTEVVSAEIDGKKIEDLSTFQDLPGDIFAKIVSDNFDKLASVHPSFLRLQGLNELVGLTKAIEGMNEKPDFSFWLKEYTLKQVRTKREVSLLKRKGELPVSSKIYTSYWEVSGGVQLVAIALRIKAGDVTAIKEAVFRTRPKRDALSWSFIAEEWIIPTSPGLITPKDVGFLFIQAVILYKKEYYDDAIKLYDEIISIVPDIDLVYNNRGLAYEKKGRYEQAISNYDKAIAINPRCIEAYVNLGAVYAEAKAQYDLAISNFNKAIEMNPNLAHAYNNRGIAFKEKGQYDKAISDLNKAIEINRDYVEAYNNRALLYSHKGQYDHALSDFNKALQINSRYFEAYNGRGLTYDAKGLYDQAISDFNKAIEINPSYFEAYNNRGLTYKHKGHHVSAISDFSKAIDINQKSSEAYCNRGEVYREMGQHDQAISDFTKALEINPTLAGAYNNRGEAFRQKGQYDQAISEFNKALAIDPELVESYNNRGVTYQQMNQYDKAMSDLNRALEINPRDAKVYYNRGVIYYYKALYDMAISDYDRAIEINPKFADAYNNRGVIYKLKRQYSRAIADFNKAIEVNPTFAGAYLNKAEACDMAGHIKEAIDSYTNFIRYTSQQDKQNITRATGLIKKLEFELKRHGNK